MLEMQEISLILQLLLHLIHVASTILIHCGVDGLPHGDLQLENLDEEIYLHLLVDRDSISHSPIIFTWIK